MAQYFIIYRTVNSTNGKFYIGQYITEDLEDGYLGSGKRLWNAIRKHGMENFAREILFIFDNFEEMNKKEKDLVTEELVKDPKCYNIALGGTGSWWHINSSGRNLFMDSEWQKKNSPHNRNDISSESRRLIKEGCRKGGRIARKIINAKVSSGEIPNGMKGKSHSEEWKSAQSERAKISQAGERNSQFGKSGRVWMYSEELKKAMKVKKEDSSPFLKKGWRYGRK